MNFLPIQIKGDLLLMLIRKSKQEKKGTKQKRISLILLTFLLILSSGIFPGYTEAEIISRGSNLKQVGPINDSNGFPLWYKDSNDVKLELCLDPLDTYCALVPEDFNANLPIIFPDNYPGEAFYQLAGTEMRVDRLRARATFALEATFNGGEPQTGDQTVFGRIRFRIDGLKPNAEYTITHPYGQDKIVADEEGEINYTEDIGAGQTFAGALNSRIGTFLKWDPVVLPQAREGYIGNPDVLHKIVGGVKDQNFFRIEGPEIGTGANYASFACTNIPNCIQTDLFSLMGKIANNNGLDIQQATHKQTSADSGSIDVFVYSEVDQNIQVSGDGIVTTLLSGGEGQYYAHVPYTGIVPPSEVTLTNLSDNAKTKKTIALVDRIAATAEYAPETQTLIVTAKSSDEVDPPTLSVVGFGDMNPESWTFVKSNLSYIPPTITITSTNKGAVTIPVNIVIGSTLGAEPIANAGADQSEIKQGTVVALDGSSSENAIAYSWKQLSGPPVTLNLANTANPTFNYPKYPYPVVFELTVTGPEGKTAKDTVAISTVPDTIAVTSAEYRRGSWRIAGTSDVFGPGVRISIKVVDSDNPNGVRIGSAFVDQLGVWRFSSAGQTIKQDAKLIIESSSGGILADVPVIISN